MRTGGRSRWLTESRWTLMLVGTVVLSVAGNGWLADGLWLSIASDIEAMSVAAGIIFALGLICAFLPLGVLALIRVREADRRRSWRGLLCAVGRELVGGRRSEDGEETDPRGVVSEGPAWMSVLAATGLGVGAGWLADGLFQGGAAQAGVGLALAVVFAWVAYLAVPRALPIHARIEWARKRDARALIVPLSDYTRGGVQTGQGEVNLLELIKSNDLESLARRIGNDEKLRNTNLRPLLVALMAHLANLKYVALIPATLSGDADVEGYRRLCSWVRGELEKRGMSVVMMNPTDSGSFQAIYLSMAEAIDEVRRLAREDGQGLLDSEIVIDVTGGKKPASIGAAAASLDREVTFEYVDTEALGDVDDGGEGCIRTFDIEYRAG